MTQANGAQLRQYIERIEHLETEKAEIADLVKDIFQEAKSNGYDTKAMRVVICKRKMDAQERAELESLEALYFEALEGNE
jgi:uncharacterized protein (UPF0335 family)